MNPVTPNISQNQTLEQPLQPQTNVGTLPPSQSKSKSLKKYIFSGIIMLVLILLGIASYFLIHKPDNYKFTINNTPVSETDFRDIYSYYKNQNKNSFNRTDTLNLIKNTYIENVVLKEAYTKEGNSLTDLNTSQVLSTLPVNEPTNFKEIQAENSVLKGKVMPKIGLKTRSGELYLLYTVASNSAQQKQLDTFMTQGLDFYRNVLQTNPNETTLQNQFLQDTQIKANPKITPRVISMENMSYAHAFLPWQDFLDKVFSTNAGQTSAVFKGVDGLYMTYGIAHITKSGNGDYNSYNQWLNTQQQSLKIVTNFSDFQ